MKIFMAGDTILAVPWSNESHPRFHELIYEIRDADVSIANLEIPVTDFRGYPQVHSGGIHIAADSGIARELRWAGFHLLSHANNHTYDYGAEGLMATLENIENVGMRIAGAGRNIEDAREPIKIEHNKGNIALTAMTTCSQVYARAGRSRKPDRGRPGVNPLAIHAGENLKKLEGKQAGLLDRLGLAGISWSGMRLIRPNREDIELNLDAIRKVRCSADYVVVSLHSHVRGAWRHAFCRQAIDAGADIVFMHGYHYVQGVEIHAGRPIFYGLGDFAFEIHRVKQFPERTYRLFGLGENATVADLHAKRRGNRDRGYDIQPEVWQSIAAVVEFNGRDVHDIQLIPIDLGWGGAEENLGRPRVAEPPLASRIIGRVARLSRRFRCRIDYCPVQNRGKVQLPTVRDSS